MGQSVTLDPMRMMELLALAMIVAIATRRLKLPYTVGLVLVGAAIAFAPLDIDGTLTHDFIFFVILPPLLFEAALSLKWNELRADAGILLVLSIIGTIVAAAIVAFGVHVLLAWPLPIAFVFGALIAATDPVAVIAMFKDNGVHGRLRTLMESESLFNDAAAAILFSVALSFANGAAPPALGAFGMHIVFVVFGGIAVGAAAGALVLLVAGRTSEHVIEVALTLLAAYGAFIIAERLGASGILATVSAGLVVGNVGVLSKRTLISQRGKTFALEFWDFTAFIANSAVFPLIGLSVAATPFSAAAIPALLGVIVLVLIGRAATIYPLSLMFSASGQRVSMAHQHVLWWGGLRGALALALALALPADLLHRQDIVVTTFAVVAFSIVVQGLTMPMLLRRLGIGGTPPQTEAE
ncbi:MAG: sodium:proton antiporter [Vitreimonas sp.]